MQDVQKHGARCGESGADGSFVSWLQQEWPRWRLWGSNYGSQLKYLGLSAEDLAQELAIVALVMRARLDPMVSSARRAYLKGVALHLVARRMRSLSRPVTLDEMPEVTDCRSEGDGAIDGGGLDMPGIRILDALKKLSPLQRKAVHARYVLDMSARDAAARLGTTPQAVDTAVAKARRRLAGIIGRKSVLA